MNLLAIWRLESGAFIQVMDKDTKKYEISFLLSRDSDCEGVIDILKKHQALGENKTGMARIKLAYPMNKEGFGYLGHSFFESKPEAIQGVSQELQMTPGILRFMISIAPRTGVSPEPKRGRLFSPRPNIESPELKTSITKEDSKPISAPPPSIGGELSNEALEKKLEEILK